MYPITKESYLERDALPSLFDAKARMSVVNQEAVWQRFIRPPSSLHIVIGGLNLIWLFWLLEFFIFFTETFNTSGRVHQFLFAGEKRMAF